MSDTLLNNELYKQLKGLFTDQLDNPVELLYFYRADNCETCNETQKLLDEITAISGKLHLSVVDIDENPQLAKKYSVSLVPGLVIAGRDGDTLIDYGIRFAGIPSGYEFTSLIQDLIFVSKRDSGLPADTRQELQGLNEPVRLQVFVTPT
jgi:glutaredoxin-like protein